MNIPESIYTFNKPLSFKTFEPVLLQDLLHLEHTCILILMDFSARPYLM